MEAKPIYPGTQNSQQNMSSSTAGKMTGTMRLIMKAKENNRRGISNHDTTPGAQLAPPPMVPFQVCFGPYLTDKPWTGSNLGMAAPFLTPQPLIHPHWCPWVLGHHGLIHSRTTSIDPGLGCHKVP